MILFLILLTILLLILIHQMILSHSSFVVLMFVVCSLTLIIYATCCLALTSISLLFLNTGCMIITLMRSIASVMALSSLLVRLLIKRMLCSVFHIFMMVLHWAGGVGETISFYLSLLSPLAVWF